MKIQSLGKKVRDKMEREIERIQMDQRPVVQPSSVSRDWCSTNDVGIGELP